MTVTWWRMSNFGHASRNNGDQEKNNRQFDDGTSVEARMQGNCFDETTNKKGNGTDGFGNMKI